MEAHIMNTSFDQRCRALSIIVLLAGMLLSACDDTNTDSALLVQPGSVEISGPVSVLLTATNTGDTLFLPLAWTVNNEDLGRITSSGGNQAAYTSNGRVGQNVVFVKDQAGREALAVINQSP
jgi:hypothetical protein